MPFPFTCPHCRHTSQVLESMARSQAKCPTCGAIVTIPSLPLAIRPGTPVPVVYAPEPPQTAPEPPPRSSRMPTLLFVGGLLLIFCCGGGGVGGLLIYRTHQNQKQADAALLAELTSKRTVTTVEKPDPPAPPPPIDEAKQPPAYWVKQLGEADSVRVDRARDRLVELGAIAVPDLRPVLRDPSPSRRLMALAILGQIGDLAAEAVGDVALLLGDPEPTVREGAVRTMTSLGRPARAALAAIFRATADPDAKVRESAEAAFRTFLPIKPEELPAISGVVRAKETSRRAEYFAVLKRAKLEPDQQFELFTALLEDSDRAIRLEAIATMASLAALDRPRVIERLFPLLDHADEQTRGGTRAALSGLGQAAPVDLPRLQAGLRAPRPETRCFCAEWIGTMGPKAAPALPFLTRALRDPEATVRTTALASLTKIGPEIRDVLDEILVLHSDPDDGVRRSVMQALGTIGRAPRVFEILVGGLKDPVADVRANAIQSMGRLKPPAGKEDLSVFIVAMGSSFPEVKRFAAEEIARLGPDIEPAMPILLDSMKDPDTQVRFAVYRALGSLGPKAKLAVPAILEEATTAVDASGGDSAERFRRAAVALGKIGALSQLLPLMRKGLRSSDATLRKECLRSIDELGPTVAGLQNDLCQLLGDAELGKQSAGVLAKYGASAVPELVRMIDKGPREQKLGAILTLSLMKPEEAKEAIVPLYTAARVHKNTDVGTAARGALEKINPAKK